MICDRRDNRVVTLTVKVQSMKSHDEEEETGWPPSIYDQGPANVRALTVACRLLTSKFVLIRKTSAAWAPHGMFVPTVGRMIKTVDRLHPKQKEKFLSVYFNALIRR